METQTGEKLVQELRGEVSNLLAAAQLLTPLVRERGSKKDMEYLAVMNQTLYRLLRTITHLELSGARPPICRKETLDLAGLCRHLDRQVAPLAERMGAAFRCDLERESLLAEADGMLLEQALLNLIANGLEAAGKGGHVVLRLSQKGERALLTVGDDGPGLREEAPLTDPLLKKPGGGRIGPVGGQADRGAPRRRAGAGEPGGRRRAGRVLPAAGGGGGRPDEVPSDGI